MAYTAARTWVHAEVISAAQGNEQWRDNMLETPAAKASAARQTVHSTGANAIAMVHSAKYKTADETIISNATLQNDDHLAWSIAANEVWAFRAVLNFAMASSSLVINAAFTVPASATGWYSVLRGNVDLDAGPGTDIQADYNIATSPVAICTATVAGRLVVLEGVVINGANAGTVQFQWCQSASTAINTTLKAGSYIDLKRLA